MWWESSVLRCVDLINLQVFSTTELFNLKPLFIQMNIDELIALGQSFLTDNM